MSKVLEWNQGGKYRVWLDWTEVDCRVLCTGREASIQVVRKMVPCPNSGLLVDMKNLIAWGRTRSLPFDARTHHFNKTFVPWRSVSKLCKVSCTSNLVIFNIAHKSFESSTSIEEETMVQSCMEAGRGGKVKRYWTGINKRINWLQNKTMYRDRKSVV